MRQVRSLPQYLLPDGSAKLLIGENRQRIRIFSQKIWNLHREPAFRSGIIRFIADAHYVVALLLKFCWKFTKDILQTSCKFALAHSYNYRVNFLQPRHVRRQTFRQQPLLIIRRNGHDAHPSFMCCADFSSNPILGIGTTTVKRTIRQKHKEHFCRIHGSMNDLIILSVQNRVIVKERSAAGPLQSLLHLSCKFSTCRTTITDEHIKFRLFTTMRKQESLKTPAKCNLA